VDPQSVGAATAVASATIAALALLLTWQRGHESQHPRLVGTAATAVVGAGAIGVALIFAGDGPQDEGAATRTSSPPLTEAEYRRDAGTICARLSESTDRIRRIGPTKSVGPVSVQIEQTALRELGRLRAPSSLRDAHRDAVAFWARRIGLIEEAYRQEAELSDKQLIARLAEVDRLTAQLNRRFKTLEIRECTF